MGRMRKDLRMAVDMLEEAERTGKYSGRGVRIEHMPWNHANRSIIVARMQGKHDVVVPESIEFSKDKKAAFIHIHYKDGTQEFKWRAGSKDPLRNHAHFLARWVRERGYVPGMDPFDDGESGEDLTIMEDIRYDTVNETFQQEEYS